MPASDEDELRSLRTLNAQEVADATGIPIETVWQAAKKGSLVGRKLGREWRFTLPAVKAWIGVDEEPTKAARPKRAASRSTST